MVNGTREFVGSEEKTLRSSIRSAIAEVSKDKLDISLQKQSDARMTLNYHAGQNTEGYHLIVAYITPHASNRIERGENKGKKLSHVQIVRNYESFSLNGKESGQVTLAAVKGISQGDTEVIGFLQSDETGKITAATKFTIKAVHS